MLVRNDAGRPVRETFFGHGTVELQPGEEKDIPEEVFKAWQSGNYWVGAQCPLVDVAAERIAQREAKKHTQEVPPADQVYKCEVKGCDREFDTPQGLAAHMRSHKDDNDNTPAGGVAF